LTPHFAAAVSAIGVAALLLSWFGLLNGEDRQQLARRRHAA